MGSCKVKRLSGHLLARERLFILSMRKKQAAAASTVTCFLPLRSWHLQRVPLFSALQRRKTLISALLTNCAGGVGSQGPVPASSRALVREQRLLAWSHWQFQICNDREILCATLKLILFWNNVWLEVPPWPKCGFMYKEQRGIKETKEKQSHVSGNNLSVWGILSSCRPPCSWKFWVKYHQMEWES